MPRTRSKNTKVTVTRRVNYKEDTDTSDDDRDGLLTNILGFLMNMQRRSAQKKPRKKSSSKTPKRKQSTRGCNCTQCTPKKRCTSKAQPKRKAKSHTATSLATSPSFNISDDEEIVSASITETHVDTIKNKVDNFFKALDSDEDELESKLNTKSTPLPAKSAEPRNKDFYTILSDSEDEVGKPSTSADNTSSFSEPSTSGLSNCVSTGLKLFSQTLNKLPERKTEDLFAYVDDILNDCNIVDITNDKPKENVPVESLEDLKKKTEEILGNVTSLIDDLKPKPKEPEKKAPESPKNAPSCPICLETLGGSRQTMTTLCGHMFCEPCIAQVAKTSKKCPTCRKGVTKTKYHQVYI